jgi:S1-C subfamily serine protease
MASSVMKSLVEHGKVIRRLLIQDIDQDLGEALGLESTNGVLVADATGDSPTEKAGLERGDVILELEGEVMESTGQLRNRIAELGAGKQVKLLK